MKLFKRISPFRIILGGFLLLILLGSLILMLPISSRERVFTPFPDALFTSTSAVCVTGLVVRDTATYWSGFGQAIILILIQIGGLGVVTMAMGLSVLAGRKIGLSQRGTMQEAISAPKLGGIVRFTLFLLKITFIIELVGAAVMAPAFIRDFGGKGIWYALFHSVSAFCNAGFDLMGVRGEFSSLTSYAADPLINVTVMILIVAGGLGFLTWNDIVTHRHRIRKYSMQSKVILVTSGVLILLPAIYFFLVEFRLLPTGERIFGSLFQSVTARTAGFNTVDQTLLSEAGVMLMILLMLIGGSPGSTAGGLKTTTFALCFSAMFSVFRRRGSAGFFGRRVADETVRTALALVMMYAVLFIGGGCVISLTEGLPLLTCLYETASAVGTVGITLGITTSLSLSSKIIIIVLMFFGRVGGLTIIYAAVNPKSADTAKYPLEKITVG